MGKTESAPWTSAGSDPWDGRKGAELAHVPRASFSGIVSQCRGIRDVFGPGKTESGTSKDWVRGWICELPTLRTNVSRPKAKMGCPLLALSPNTTGRFSIYSSCSCSSSCSCGCSSSLPSKSEAWLLTWVIELGVFAWILNLDYARFALNYRRNFSQWYPVNARCCKDFLDWFCGGV